MGQDRRHAELQALAEKQWSVLKVAQIRAAGFSDRDIQGLLADGILHRRFKGIYTYGAKRIDWRGVLLAAQWSIGEDAFLTGRTALGIEKIGGCYLGRIEVAVPRRTVRTRQPPIVLSRVSAPPPRLRSNGPLRWAPATDAIAHLGRSGMKIDRLITEAMHHSRFDHARMREIVAAGGPGVAALRASYREYLPAPNARSGLERAFDRGLATRPWIPEPERNRRMTVAGISWEIDRLWPEQHLALELDGGGYHDPKADREKDSFKAAKLALVGISTLRISDTRYELEPEACLDDLEGMLARGGWRRAA